MLWLTKSECYLHGTHWEHLRKLAFTMTSAELKNISTELKHLSLKRQQLLERKKIQCIFQELRKRAEFGQTEDESNQLEIDSIDEKLKQLTEQRAELQKTQDNLLKAEQEKNNKNETKIDVSFDPSPKIVPGPGPLTKNIFYVEPPPTIPAPTVILDLENLPPHPSRTQCPECREFIMTETFSSVSSVTWLMCVITAMIGCVAGCCLIPLCLKRFKSITHRCPKCRTPIHTVKKL